jgi:hypothetical protein
VIGGSSERKVLDGERVAGGFEWDIKSVAEQECSSHHTSSI